jgi:hypothetical protein
MPEHLFNASSSRAPLTPPLSNPPDSPQRAHGGFGALEQLVHSIAQSAASTKLEPVEKRFEESISHANRRIAVHEQGLKDVSKRTAAVEEDTAELRDQQANLYTEQQASDELAAKAEKRVEKLEAAAQTLLDSSTERFEAHDKHIAQLQKDLDAARDLSSKAVAPLEAAVAKLEEDVPAQLLLFAKELKTRKEQIEKYEQQEALRHQELLGKLRTSIWAEFRDFIREAVGCEVKMLNGEMGGAPVGRQPAKMSLHFINAGAAASQADRAGADHGALDPHQACTRAIDALATRCDDLQLRTKQLEAAKRLPLQNASDENANDENINDENAEAVDSQKPEPDAAKLLLGELTKAIKQLNTRLEELEEKHDSVPQLFEDVVIMQNLLKVQEKSDDRFNVKLSELRGDLDEGQRVFERQLKAAEDKLKAIETKFDALDGAAAQPSSGNAATVCQQDLIDACNKVRESTSAECGAVNAQLIELRASTDGLPKASECHDKALRQLHKRLEIVEKRMDKLAEARRQRRSKRAQSQAGSVRAPSSSASRTGQAMEQDTDDGEAQASAPRPARKRRAPARMQDSEEPAAQGGVSRKRKRPAANDEDSEYEPDEPESSHEQESDDSLSPDADAGPMLPDDDVNDDNDEDDDAAAEEEDDEEQAAEQEEDEGEQEADEDAEPQPPLPIDASSGDEYDDDAERAARRADVPRDENGRFSGQSRKHAPAPRSDAALNRRHSQSNSKRLRLRSRQQRRRQESSSTRTGHSTEQESSPSRAASPASSRFRSACSAAAMLRASTSRSDQESSHEESSDELEVPLVQQVPAAAGSYRDPITIDSSDGE